MKWIIASLCVIVASLILLQSQRKREEHHLPGQMVNVTMHPRALSTDSALRWNPSPGPVASTDAGISGKLNRLYSKYQSSPNPGYTNILETLRTISIEEPTVTDLFKDACSFVALRTELAKLIQREIEDHQKTREGVMRLNLSPEAQSNALSRFEANPKVILESLRQTDDAVVRVFKERFAQRHGLDRDLVIERLSSLTLTSPGPELWIQCDESMIPYPEPPKTTNTGPLEFLKQFRY